MDERPDDDELPSVSALRPVQLGRSLPVPPVLPLVGLFCVLVGLGLGYGVAPKPGPAALPSPAPATILATASAAVAAQDSPVAFEVPSAPVDPPQPQPSRPVPIATPPDLPPAGGLTAAQALEALTKSGLGVSPSAVISARVAHDRDVSGAYANRTDQWVWALEARGDFSGPAACPSRFDDPAARAPCGTVATALVIILDYRTGALVEAYALVQ